MSALPLHPFHATRGAMFSALNGVEIVSNYGSIESEYRALVQSAALLDESFRGRICILGSDREKFLHGQVTNDVARLKTGQGCYAALINAKGRIQSDLFVYKLRDELLLDFEPGLTGKVTERLEKYIIADDVQCVDVAPHYGLISVRGPKAADVLRQTDFVELPIEEFGWISRTEGDSESYVMRNSRFGVPGYDLFIPTANMEATALALERAVQSVGGRWAGFDALEIARIENGVPRFGIDMNDTNLAPEAEIQETAISYAKGCYIGQEVIARIRTYGQVAKALRLLRLPSEGGELPPPGTKLFKGEKEVGYITSSTLSPKHGAKIALGYVRKEANAPGEQLNMESADGRKDVTVLAKAGAAGTTSR